MRMRFALSAAIAVVMLSAAAPCAAQSSPPAPVDINVPMVAQDTPEWCWLAVASMILAMHQDHPPRQCEMAEQIDHLQSGSCCSDIGRCSRCAIDLHEVEQVLDRYGIGARYTMAILPNALYSHLQAGHPVIAQIRRMGGTHAVVIRGMRYERDHSRPDGWRPVVIYNDPTWGRNEMPYDDFALGWMDSIIVTH